MTTLASQIHLHNPDPPTTNSKRVYIIYFITGNPGLIEYYRTFLTHLYGLFTHDSRSSTSIHVFGRSLSGFETQPFSSPQSSRESRPPFSLQEQILHSEEALERLVGEVKEMEGMNDVRVVLMGHSVGTYICLETIRRAREKKDGVRIVGGVMLFATVMDLAKSDSGRKATTLFRIPSFPLLVSLFAKALTFLIPLSMFTFLVQQVMKFPPDAAHVTASFVKSPHGVQQALHMAGDELREISIDKWDTDLWGALTPTRHRHPRPILRFLFAKKDHWVADETRDALIKARGAQSGAEEEHWKPVMEVDEDEGWVHSFCVSQSIPVAESVHLWVREVIDQDNAR